jgi:hypothetical protein
MAVDKAYGRNLVGAAQNMIFHDAEEELYDSARSAELNGTAIGVNW